MEIVSIERKTFEEMKERFGSFSQHVRELCARYRSPEKMNWMDGADVCEKLGISKRTLQTYRDRGLLPSFSHTSAPSIQFIFPGGR